ncbi:Mov34/MPN/PAD-1 family protein [Pantoea sp. RG18]|uniref:Mov34/MPN/PAD-1 family protein n=1 Tax=Pantoea sp. RG18 TaxID=2981603 RepID=UPI00221F372A|nr:Mov34/MPN/PAD-1 family protein [Pantoea sp. RG18]MCW0938432.1 Mov34/MPN/PAD-1 family protein [Pantoea sp. RG18]
MNGITNNLPSLAWAWEWEEYDFKIQVSEYVSTVFNDHRQHGHKIECGGLLFIDPSFNNGLWLSSATLPHPSDKSTRHWVEFNPNRCESEQTQARKHGLIFAGYWHTHPQSIPALSNQDKTSIERFYLTNKNIISSPIFIIVGTSPCKNGIKAWAYKNESFLEGVVK